MSVAGSTGKVVAVVSAVTVGAIVIGYLGVQVFFLPDTISLSQLSRVPDLTNRTLVEAAEIGAQQEYVVVSTGEKFATGVDAGHVVYQVPPPGAYLAGGDTLRVLLSAGPERVRIPDMSGLDPETARSILRRLGMEITPDRNETSDVHDLGTVIRTVPARGAPLNRGTAVTLVVSGGGMEVAMPDVMGLSLTAARESLEGVGLVVGEIAGVQEGEPGSTGSVVVVGQDPQARDRLRAGSAVRLQLGEGEAGSVGVPPGEIDDPAADPTENVPPPELPPDQTTPEDSTEEVF